MSLEVSHAETFPASQTWILKHSWPVASAALAILCISSLWTIELAIHTLYMMVEERTTRGSICDVLPGVHLRGNGVFYVWPWLGCVVSLGVGWIGLNTKRCMPWMRRLQLLPLVVAGLWILMVTTIFFPR